MLTYTPVLTNTGYSGAPPVKSDQRRTAAPDGTFKITVLRMAGSEKPPPASVIITDSDDAVLWSDALQSLMFYNSDGTYSNYDFVWDNSQGCFDAGTIFVHVLVSKEAAKYEVVIPDSPFLAAANIL